MTNPMFGDEGRSRPGHHLEGVASIDSVVFLGGRTQSHRIPMGRTVYLPT